VCGNDNEGKVRLLQKKCNPSNSPKEESMFIFKSTLLVGMPLIPVVWLAINSV